MVYPCQAYMPGCTRFSVVLNYQCYSTVCMVDLLKHIVENNIALHQEVFDSLDGNGFLRILWQYHKIQRQTKQILVLTYTGIFTTYTFLCNLTFCLHANGITILQVFTL